MTNEDHQNQAQPPLFEMPSGIDVVPEERHLITDHSLPVGRQMDRPTGHSESRADQNGTGSDDLGFDLADSERLLEGFDPEANVHRAKRGKLKPISTIPAPGFKQGFRSHFRTATSSPGAHFVYALVALTVALGVLGLALTWRDGRVLAACAVITPLSLTWFVIRFRAWLNSATYWYRLLTSLGENADNLSHFRVRRAIRHAVRALYS